jgi:hypothetical protein
VMATSAAGSTPERPRFRPRADAKVDEPSCSERAGVTNDR